MPAWLGVCHLIYFRRDLERERVEGAQRREKDAKRTEEERVPQKAQYQP